MSSDRQVAALQHFVLLYQIDLQLFKVLAPPFFAAVKGRRVATGWHAPSGPNQLGCGAYGVLQVDQVLLARVNLSTCKHLHELAAGDLSLSVDCVGPAEGPALWLCKQVLACSATCDKQDDTTVNITTQQAALKVLAWCSSALCHAVWGMAPTIRPPLD
jgi:hypothetical protein